MKGDAGILKKIMGRQSDELPLTDAARQKLEELKAQKPNTAKFLIKVLGVSKVKKINVTDNDEMEQRILRVVQKDSCMDLFKQVSGIGTEAMSHEQFMNYKFEKKSKEITLSKIRILMNLKIITGYTIVNSILKKIEVQKDLLVLDVQLGKEVFLGAEFSMSNLPASFRYYDPILRIIQKKLKPSRTRYFMNQKQLARVMRTKSMSYQLLKQAGLKEGEHDKKLVIR